MSIHLRWSIKMLQRKLLSRYEKCAQSMSSNFGETLNSTQYFSVDVYNYGKFFFTFDVYNYHIPVSTRIYNKYKIIEIECLVVTGICGNTIMKIRGCLCHKKRTPK